MEAKELGFWDPAELWLESDLQRNCQKKAVGVFVVVVYFSSVSERMGSGKENLSQWAHCALLIIKTGRNHHQALGIRFGSTLPGHVT